MQKHHVIREGKRHWVTGLHWQLADETKRLERRARARATGGDHFVHLSQTATPLIGSAELSLTELTPREMRNACALAPQLLPLLGENEWAILTLDEGQFYFLATLDGSLSLLSDIAGSQEEITAALTRYREYAGDTPVSAAWCPGGFIPEATAAPESSVAELLTGRPVARAVRLRPVSTQRAAILWGLAIGIALAGWYGINAWQEWDQEQQREKARQLLAQSRERIKAAPPQPWTSVPVPGTFITTCSAAWTTPLSAAGWPFQTAQCARDKEGWYVRLAWHRQEGSTLDPFRARMAELYPGVKPFFNIPGAADTGGVRLPVVMPVSPQRAEEPGDADEITQRLTNYAMQIGAKLTLKENNAMTTFLDGNAVDLPWQTFHFQLLTELPPDLLFGPDINSSGIRLDAMSMTLNGARLHYSLEGTLYATK